MRGRVMYTVLVERTYCSIVAKYPELRDGFTAVIARAVDSSGTEYGSVLPMKDVK